ncbi:MAG TPA: hypothetical protein VN238_11970 [Solirubrobacteraceae bacterium]|nr:hypothetical protein [Solirubrobacteraceae bacterium]
MNGIGYPVGKVVYAHLRFRGHTELRDHLHRRAKLLTTRLTDFRRTMQSPAAA